MTLFAAVARGRRSATSLGSWIAWAAGYYGRMELLEKNKLIHINPKHLAPPTAGSSDHGDATVFWSPDAADRPHLHLAARRRRADAVLALHDPHARSAASPGCSA